MTDIDPISEAELSAALEKLANGDSEITPQTPEEEEDGEVDLEAGPEMAGDDPIILPAGPGYSELASHSDGDSDDEDVGLKPVNLSECLSAYCTKETLSGLVLSHTHTHTYTHTHTHTHTHTR